MGHGFSRIERIHADYFGSIGCESVESVLLSRKSFASWKRFLPRTMATSVHVHVHDHVNVHELRPRLTLVVDVLVVVDVIGFFICGFAAPGTFALTRGSRCHLPYQVTSPESAFRNSTRSCCSCLVKLSGLILGESHLLRYP